MFPAHPARAKANRKPLIVAAAEGLLRERGLAGVTTRAIAERVPCSEGAIYVHFENRIALLLTVLEESLPEMLIPLRALEGKAGLNTPHKNLIAGVQGLLRFHERVVPMLSSLFAEPELLHGFRQALALRGGKGPQGGIARITAYIQAEQKLGRVASTVNAEAIATALMSMCFFQAFTRALLGETLPSLSAKKIVNFLL